MATTRDYVDYLSDQIDIAPVNSQEELQAAELLQHIMEQHQLDVRVQEFEASSSGVLPYRILMVLMFLGVVLSGFYGTPAAAAGVVLVFVCGALFLLKQLGYDFLSNLGGKARSQNVIGVHHAEGPLVVKGNRPIVIVAHYDTPRESLLYKGPIARVQPTLKRIAPVLVGIAFVLGIFQLFGFVPEVARRVLWVLGLIVALPLLFLGVDAIYNRFSACTEGANDNKSSLAAMLSVLDKVRPGEDGATGFSRVMDDRRAVARAAAAAREEEEARAAAEAAEAEAASAADAAYDDSFDMELDEYDEFDAAEGLDELSDEDDFGSYDEGVATEEDAFAVDSFEEPAAPAPSPFASVAGVFSKIWPFNKEPHEEEPLEESEELFEDEGDFGEDYSAYADAEYNLGVDYADDAEGLLEPVEETYDEEAEPATEPAVEFEPVSFDETAYDNAEEPEFAPYEQDVYGVAESAEVSSEPEPYEEGSYFDVSEAYEEPEERFAEPEPAAVSETQVKPLPSDFLPNLVTMPFDDVFDEAADGAEGDFYADEAPYEQVYDETYDEAYDEQPVAEEAPQEPEPADVAPTEPQPFIPSFARVRTGAVARREPEPPAEPEIAPQVVTDRYEEVVGVRHGKEVVESLRMLPVGCDVEYLEPRLLSRSVRPQDEIDRAEFGVISAGSSDDWEPIVHSNRRERPSYEERPSFFERIRMFFAQLREQFLGEEVDDDTMLDADFEDDYGYEDDLGYEEDGYDAQLDASYWDDPASKEQQEEPAEDPNDYAENDYADEAYEDEVAYEQYEEAQEPLDEPFEPSYGEVPQAGYSYEDDAYAAPAPVDSSILAPNLTFQDEPLPSDDEIELMDGSGLTEVVDYDLNDSEPMTITPAPKAAGVDDPTWGRSEYQPPRSNVARRASLFDLPDPSSRSADPFADPSMTGAGRRSSLRLVDDEEDPRNGRWKGGATTRVGLRDGDEQSLDDEAFDEQPCDIDAAFDYQGDAQDEAVFDDVVPEEEQVAETTTNVEEMQELRDAILSMGDDELIAHDIWFVALGASELNHAGMTAFLRENRSKIRGAFMVNLDSVGAGMLTMLTNEGLFNNRRTDRRMLRMLGNIADDLHISVDKAEHGWEDTDATQAMRKSVRALTIMGVENGVAALSHTAYDTADEVDPAQVADVAAMVTELIRRA